MYVEVHVCRMKFLAMDHANMSIFSYVTLETNVIDTGTTVTESCNAMTGLTKEGQYVVLFDFVMYKLNFTIIQTFLVPNI